MIIKFNGSEIHPIESKTIFKRGRRYNMGYSLRMLEDTFMSAYRSNMPFVGIRVRVAGMKADEFIINPHANILSKLEYYKQAYNNDLTLKANNNIQIVSVAYGYTFDELQRIL